jgi:shikimate kinase
MTKSNEPKALKEIHDIREKLYAETKDLSPKERSERRELVVNEVIEKYGLKIIKKSR